jgi:putative flippase GtrA
MSLYPGPSSTLKRWLVFSSIGAIGIAVQMLILLALTSGLGIHYLPATGMAVESALLHNFLWHEHWTWADRVRDQKGGLFRRLLYFHLTNGAVSLAGNLALMWLFVEKLGWNYMLANAAAIALCSILNFVSGDRIVFRNSRVRLRKGFLDVSQKLSQCTAWTLIPAAASCLLLPAPVKAADLKPETLEAWNKYVERTEHRVAVELSSPIGFLALDFQDFPEAARARQALFAGEILIERLTVSDPIRIPDGMIHDWRGSAFIPGVSLDFVFSRVKNPKPEDTRQEDVLDSRILENTPGQLKIYLKLHRSKIVTVVYNTEHLVRYRRYSEDRASSSSVATKISEIERLPENREREKPEGHDRGFLWRMNSYWRYQQINGGVIVECESITLSRSVPPPLEYLIRPLINRTARESMERTLQSMRTRLVRGYKSSPETSRSQLRVVGPKFQAAGRIVKPVVCNPGFQGFRSRAARVVVGSISEKATKAPIATAISSVAMIACSV